MWTQEEIAASEDMTQQAGGLILQKFPKLEKLLKPMQTLAAYAEPEWNPPICKVWKQQTGQLRVTSLDQPRDAGLVTDEKYPASSVHSGGRWDDITEEILLLLKDMDM